MASCGSMHTFITGLVGDVRHYLDRISDPSPPPPLPPPDYRPANTANATAVSLLLQPAPYTLTLTQTEELMSTGLNSNGQLGHGDIQPVRTALHTALHTAYSPN